MAATGNEALVRRLYEAVWNEGDLAVADELVSPTEVHHTADGVTQPGGPEAQKRTARIFREAFPDNRLSIELVVDGGELVAVRWRIAGAQAATGRRVNYAGVNIFRIVDGTIVEIWDTRDDLGLCAQLGLIPPWSELRAQVYPNAPRQ